MSVLVIKSHQQKSGFKFQAAKITIFWKEMKISIFLAFENFWLHSLCVAVASFYCSHNLNKIEHD